MSNAKQLKKILVCTVGGSHAPILQSLKDHQPDYVYFICTEGKKGSIIQITGEGSCIKSSPQDENPTLANIPTQARLGEKNFECITVSADNPDEIHEKCRSLFRTLTNEALDAKIIADYTGGTKSMTAGLLLASLEYDRVEPYLVSGQRSNLEKVVDGTQTSLPANVEQIRFRNQWKIAMSPWSHFGYSESVIGIECMNPPSNDQLRSLYLSSLAASRAFTEWDRFNHVEAYQLLKSQGAQFGKYLTVLSNLNFESSNVQEPSRLLDLKLNMLRRAERQLYDDAVGRAYRLLEWTAQWLLKHDANIDTGNVPIEKIPDTMEIYPNDSGIRKAGLRQAWQLLKEHGNKETKQFVIENEKLMMSHLSVRNNSILAHGYTPVSKEEWNKFHDWMKKGFFPLLESQAAKCGVKTLPLQLPQSFYSE